MVHVLTAAYGAALVVGIVVAFAFYTVKNVHHLYITSSDYEVL